MPGPLRLGGEDRRIARDLSHVGMPRDQPPVVLGIPRDGIIAPPGGESLKDTAERVLPYFEREILPRVLAGERVIVSAHGNSLRAHHPC